MKASYISNEAYSEQVMIAARVKQHFGSNSGKYFIETYGCQMNVRDSETIAGFLEAMGFSKAENKDEASFIYFNTCCVRDHAEKKLMANIGALKKRKDAEPFLIICIGGCMMQEPGVAQKVMQRFSYVDAVIGTNAFWKLPSIVSRILVGEHVIDTDEHDYAICEHMPAKRTPGVSAFVNIMFGCDNFCSYCIVPYVRGRERSRAPEDILAEVRSLVDSGISEITLLGQNVNSYGRGSDCNFAQLLRKVNEVEGLKRIRFMTSHPKDLSDELIFAIRDCSKVARHIHLPLQSGSNRILKEMNRRYTAEHYLSLIAKLRREIRGIEITTDIIVGFPGESEEDFSSTLSMVEQIGYSSAFTFKYSPRNGTKAASMDNQIPESLKKERLARLNALQAKMTQKSNIPYLGTTETALIEGYEVKESSVIVHGRLSNFKMVYLKGTPEMVNQFCQVRITDCNNNSLIGEIE